MAGLFSKPKAPAMPAIQEQGPSKEEISKKAEDERRRRNLAAGRASTIKTSRMGVTQDPSVSAATLLG